LAKISWRIYRAGAVNYLAEAQITPACDLPDQRSVHVMLSDAVFEAIEFAARAHRHQHRKGTGVPYIIHPLGVAHILIDHDLPEDLVIAGILHDTVEDTDVTLDQIAERFGGRVAKLVAGASEPDKSDSWENRKRDTIEYLRTAPEDVALVACADKLDNIRSIRRDYARLGDRVWDHFKRKREQQCWYFRNLAEVFRSRADGERGRKLFHEFVDEVEAFFIDDPGS
jgi:(p)ppGpp synthase/HD superfamily hydrolase